MSNSAEKYQLLGDIHNIKVEINAIDQRLYTIARQVDDLAAQIAHLNVERKLLTERRTGARQRLQELERP
jgi:predicted  nucleic acid-binding Zn-ribbon protein